MHYWVKRHEMIILSQSEVDMPASDALRLPFFKEKILISGTECGSIKIKIKQTNIRIIIKVNKQEILIANVVVELFKGT